MKYLRIFAAVSLIFLNSCGTGSSPQKTNVIIGISADVESLNPLYSFTYYEGVISELIYLSLVQHEWNFETGQLQTSPMLAESYVWSEDSASINIKLRDDIYWSDGLKVTAEDVVFSFYIYSHPDVQSRLYGMFKNFYVLENQTIDRERSFVVKNPSEFTINFKENTTPAIFDIDLPVLPAHIFSRFEPSEIIQKEKEIPFVTNGAYKVHKWNKNQSIILSRNEESFLITEESLEQIIFKVVPDYTSRLTQLKNGEIDIIEELRPEDAASLSKSKELKVTPIEGREYDYIGWSHIDMDVYNRTGKRVPHKLFGSKVIRKALSLAINRKEIIEEYFNNYGKPAAGPVAPIFRSIYNNEISPYDFNPDSASSLLKSEGWRDLNGDGVLEKDGRKLSFTIFIPSSNPSREFASKIIENNLLAIGVKANIEQLEPGVFFERMFNRGFEAWLAGWSVAIPIELKVFWHSDMQNNPLNLSGYSNKRIDEILEKTASMSESSTRDKLLKELQEIIHREEPVTFLYWIDNLAAYNKRIIGISVTPLGSVHHPWEWIIRQ